MGLHGHGHKDGAGRVDKITEILRAEVLIALQEQFSLGLDQRTSINVRIWMLLEGGLKG